MKKIYWPLAFIIPLTILAYLPLRQAGFLIADDPEQITQNSDITSLSGATLSKIFSTYYVGMYQPLTTFSYALNYRLSGFDPLSFHFTNLFLHLVNIILVYILGWLLFKNRRVALAGAAIFALWPTQVEAVAWLSARSTLLSSAFILACLISLTLFLEQHRKLQYWLIWLFFLLSLFSKATSIILPCLIFLVVYYRTNSIKKAVKLSWPFIFPTLIFGLMTIRGRAEYGLLAETGHSLAVNLVILGDAFALQLRLLFWPFGLSAYYPQLFAHDAVFQPLAYYLLLVPLAYLSACFYFRKNKLMLFALLWFALNIILCIQILPQTPQGATDRYNYLAVLGLAWPLGRLFKNYQAKIYQLAAFSLLLVMAVFVWGQCQTWQNDLTQWQNAVNVAPNSPIVWYNYGEIKRANGDNQAAEAIADSLISDHPSYANGYFLKGIIRLNAGDNNQAGYYFNQAAKLNPLPAYYYNLALAQAATGHKQASLDSLLEAEKNIQRPKQRIYLLPIRQKIDQLKKQH